MTEEQASLSTNFTNFINVLRNIEGGLPDIHIGVITTDMGGGPVGCEGNGDNGQLRTSPSISGDYIVDIDDGSQTGARTTNYSGTLESAFSSIAVVGDTGCCDEINGCAPGPLHSYRCFEFGVRCDPDQPRITGTRNSADCVPRDDSDRIASVGGYADFLRGYKSDPSLVITAGIIAPPGEFTTVNQISRTTPSGAPLPDALELEPSCSSTAGEGFPGIRLNAFFSAFPTRSTVTTICNQDLSDALVQIADLVTSNLGTPCLRGDIKTDPLECSVADVRFAGQDSEIQSKPMPVCSDTSNTDPETNPSDNKPCYIISADSESCSGFSTQLKLTVVREAGAEPPIGTTTTVRCVAN